MSHLKGQVSLFWPHVPPVWLSQGTKIQSFFAQVISLNCSCILLWWFNGKIQKTKDTPLTLLCTLILELFPPMCSCCRIGNVFGMWGSAPAGRAMVLLPWICSAHEWWIWCSREVQKKEQLHYVWGSHRAEALCVHLNPPWCSVRHMGVHKE